tara:strand:- start:148 stop:1002 length:855 start_codon:yes stop_codon:yes gene_type:complete
MKKLLLLSLVLSVFSCNSDIVPDSQKVCALMEDQLEFLDEGFERMDRQIIAINLMNYENIQDQIVSIKSKYDKAKFDEQLYSICTDGEGEILELVNILEEELLYLDVAEVCRLQGINYRRFIDYFDSDQYYYDGTIRVRRYLTVKQIEEGIKMYDDYTLEINQIWSKQQNENLFEGLLADICDERYSRIPIDYSVLSKFYDVLKSELESKKPQSIVSVDKSDNIDICKCLTEPGNSKFIQENNDACRDAISSEIGVDNWEKVNMSLAVNAEISARFDVLANECM